MKTVIILRGLPGSGKSTIAELLCGAVVSMDDFFIDSNGEYQFDGKKIPEAVLWAHNQFDKLVNSEVGLIIVDNTATRFFEYEYYYKTALEHGYQVHVLHVESSVAECAMRNQHHVPLTSINKMKARWESFE